MQFRFHSLILDTPRRQEIIDLDHQLIFFHGQVSAGKSSILRLIDYCLGGDLELTVAIQNRLVSATLNLTIGQHEVILEREKPPTELVRVTWTNAVGETAVVLAPLQQRPGHAPIWEGGLYTLSDLLFHLAGTVPMRVRRSKINPESELVRLSFRNLMWYCYLKQEFHESSFYSLESSEKKYASRDVLRYVIGYYTDRQTELERDVDRVRQSQITKRQSVLQMRELMKEMGYETSEAVATEFAHARDEHEAASAAMAVLQADKASAVHPAEALRRKMRDLSAQIDGEDRALADIGRRIEQQVALRAELVSTKFKMARAVVATSLLGNVDFHSCPQCGNDLSTSHAPADCGLCKQPTQVVTPAAISAPPAQAERTDLNSRIDELAESLRRHREARRFQEKRLESLIAEKHRGDTELSRQLTEYDSAYMAATRDLQSRLATAQERMRNIDRARRLPEKIAQLEREADEDQLKEAQLRREIESEKAIARRSESLIRRLEGYYHEALLAVHVPHVMPGDKVVIDPRDWIPKIFPENDPDSAYEFGRAGSGGKKTLMNICYALALHRLVAEERLRLPSFLMIDTPMKNIGEVVNHDLFERFYEYLYHLASGPLKDTQFVIGDIHYVEPPSELGLDVIARFMTREDPTAPPLFSDYVGP